MLVANLDHNQIKGSNEFYDNSETIFSSSYFPKCADSNKVSLNNQKLIFYFLSFWQNKVVDLKLFKFIKVHWLFEQAY